MEAYDESLSNRLELGIVEYCVCVGFDDPEDLKTSHHVIVATLGGMIKLRAYSLVPLMPKSTIMLVD
jgi:hypothetical protein